MPVVEWGEKESLMHQLPTSNRFLGHNTFVADTRRCTIYDIAMGTGMGTQGGFGIAGWWKQQRLAFVSSSRRLDARCQYESIMDDWRLLAHDTACFSQTRFIRQNIYTNLCSSENWKIGECASGGVEGKLNRFWRVTEYWMRAKLCNGSGQVGFYTGRYFIQIGQWKHVFYIYICL